MFICIHMYEPYIIVVIVMPRSEASHFGAQIRPYTENYLLCLDQRLCTIYLYVTDGSSIFKQFSINQKLQYP